MPKGRAPPGLRQEVFGSWRPAASSSPGFRKRTTWIVTVWSRLLAGPLTLGSDLVAKRFPWARIVNVKILWIHTVDGCEIHFTLRKEAIEAIGIQVGESSDTSWFLLGLTCTQVCFQFVLCCLFAILGTTRQFLEGAFLCDVWMSSLETFSFSRGFRTCRAVAGSRSTCGSVARGLPDPPARETRPRKLVGWLGFKLGVFLSPKKLPINMGSLGCRVWFLVFGVEFFRVRRPFQQNRSSANLGSLFGFMGPHTFSFF